MSNVTYRHGNRITPLSKVVKCLCLFLLLQIALLPRVKAQAGWYKFTSPNNDFTISFPGKPNYVPQTDSHVNRRIERFSLTFENHYLEVHYIDLANRRETKEQIEASLEGIKSGYLQSLKNGRGRLLSLARIPEGGYQFDSIIPLRDGTPAHNRTRVYVLGSRQYTISCATWNQDGIDELLATKFLDSFTFNNSSNTKAEQSRGNKSPTEARIRGTRRRALRANKAASATP